MIFSEYIDRIFTIVYTPWIEKAALIFLNQNLSQIILSQNFEAWSSSKLVKYNGQGHILHTFGMFIFVALANYATIILF